MKENESVWAFESLFNALDAGMALHELIYDQKGKAIDYKITDINQRCSDILGLSRAEAIGTRASELYQTGEPLYLEIYARVAESKQSETFETYFSKLDKYFQIQVYAPTRQKFATIFFDITRQKQLQQEMKRSETEKMQILDSQMEHVIYQDKEMRVIWANRAACDSVNMSRQDLMGRYCYEVWQQRQKPCEDCPVLKAINRGDPHAEEKSTPDGRFWFVRGYPVRNAEGEIVGAIEVTRDITDNKHAKARVERLNSLLLAIRNVNQLIVQERDINKMMQGACQSLVETRAYLGCTIALMDSNEDKIIPIASAGKHEFAGQWSLSIQGEGAAPACVKRPIKTKSVQIVDNARDCKGCTYKTDNWATDYCAAIVPLISDDQPVGLLFVVFEREIEIDQEELDLLQEVADDLAFARAKLAVEEKLRESRQLLYAAIEQSPAGILIADAPDVKIRLANSAALNVRGGTRGELTNIDIEKHVKAWQVFHLNGEPYDPKELPLSRAVLYGGIVYGEEVIIQDSKGMLRNVIANAAPVRNKQGQITAGVVVFTDITERKRSEEKLRKSEALYRGLFNHVPVGLYRSTPDGKILDVNPVFLKMVGFPNKKELLKLNAKDIYVNPEDRKQLELYQERDGIIRGYESQWKRYDGKLIWTRNSGRAVRDSDGNIIYYEGAVEDITEQKNLEEQIQRVQRLEAVGKLAAGIAHDFNNLLTVIIGHAEYMSMQMDSKNPNFDTLAEISEAAERASKLTRQLLLYSRKQAMEYKPININRTVEHLLKMLRRLIGEDITIKTRFEPDLWIINGDEGNLEQVIANISVNARDAMPDGGEIIIQTKNVNIDKIQSRNLPYSKPGDYVCLSMEDTGTGIKKAYLNRIFDPFFTTKTPGKGTGMGLSVVYGIIKKHNGWINVYSELDKGTIFKIYLPAITKLDQKTGEPKVSLESVKGTGETILLIEDEKGVRKFTREILEKNGYQVFSAENAHKAWGLFARRQAALDLIFCDVILPDKDGLTLVQEFMQENPNIPVIMCSGYTEEKVQTTLIREQGYKFIHKPYSMLEVLQTIKDILKPAGADDKIL